jgi:hypothetical protein
VLHRSDGANGTSGALSEAEALLAAGINRILPAKPDVATVAYVAISQPFARGNHAFQVGTSWKNPTYATVATWSMLM